MKGCEAASPQSSPHLFTPGDMARLNLWLATIWLAYTTVSLATWNATVFTEATKAVYAANPAFKYDSSWTLACFRSDAPQGILLGSQNKGQVGVTPNFYFFNSTSTGSFSISFYGQIEVLNMSLTPLDPAQTSTNVTFSLDGFTWTTEVNATSMPSLAGANLNTIWPALDMGPSAPQMKMGAHNLTVTVGNVVASFRQMVIKRAFQTVS